MLRPTNTPNLSTKWVNPPYRPKKGEMVVEVKGTDARKRVLIAVLFAAESKKE
jgi:hypothetical protein